MVTLLKKPKEKDDCVSLKQRVGLAASVLLKLSNKDLNVYSAKLGVMLIAAGKHELRSSSYFSSFIDTAGQYGLLLGTLKCQVDQGSDY